MMMMMITYKAMSVNVHGVGGLIFVVHDDADCFVGAEVVHVPFGI